MDQTVVRVPPGITAKPGDEVMVLGDGTDVAPTAEQLAEQLETISYEVVTSLAARLPRHYVKDGEVIAVESLPLAP